MVDGNHKKKKNKWLMALIFKKAYLFWQKSTNSLNLKDGLGGSCTYL